MNINFEYYDACYRICVLNEILSANGVIPNDKVHVTEIAEDFRANTVSVLTEDDGLASYDSANFQITFERKGKEIDFIMFVNNFKAALKYQDSLQDPNCSIDLKLLAMRKLSPSALSSFLKRKPMLNSTEMALVIAKAKELEQEVLNLREEENRGR